MASILLFQLSRRAFTNKCFNEQYNSLLSTCGKYKMNRFVIFPTISCLCDVQRKRCVYQSKLFCHNGPQTGEKPETKWNLRRKIKYLLLGVCGLHVSFWGVKKLFKNKKRQCPINEQEYEVNHYVVPLTKDKDGLLKYNGVWLPYVMVNKKVMKQIQEFKVDPNDIFVISYPKSGTTWVQEIVYLLHNKDKVVEAFNSNLNDKFPFLEFPYPGIDVITNFKRPRLIKSHLPYELLPASVNKSNPKIIYIARNVKDVSISYYHFHRMWTQIAYSGTVEDFLEDFIIGRVSYGSWWQHVKTFWEKRDQCNILFLKYEELHKHPVQQIDKIAKFLDITVDNSTKIKIATLCTFSKMKENPGTNNHWMEDYGLIVKSSDPNMQFMRKGQIGDWKNYYTKDLANVLDDKTEKELASLGLHFCDSR